MNFTLDCQQNEMNRLSCLDTCAVCRKLNGEGIIAELSITVIETSLILIISIKLGFFLATFQISLCTES